MVLLALQAIRVTPEHQEIQEQMDLLVLRVLVGLVAMAASMVE